MLLARRTLVLVVGSSSAEPMRVLHVISGIDPRLGGPPQVIVGLLQAQVSAGASASLISTWTAAMGDLSLSERLKAGGVSVRLVGPVHRPLGWTTGLGRAVAAMVAQADVVHIHALWEQIQHAAARKAQQMGRPYLITPHGMLDPHCLRASRLAKKVYLAWRLRRNLNHAAAIHFTTETERNLTVPLRLQVPGIVEPNGLDLTEFDPLPAPGSFRSRYPAVGDRPMLLFLSRLHPKKGLDLLIPAFARAAVPQAVLVLAGPADDHYRAQLEALISAHGVSDRVVMTGMLHGPDRVAALVDADLFVLPSYQENFGIAVVEALAAETPVVISDQVNIHAEIAAAQVGGVVPTQIEPLTAAIQQWMIDLSMRKAAAARCRPFVQQEYDWNAIARRWLIHYDRLISHAAVHRD